MNQTTIPSFRLLRVMAIGLVFLLAGFFLSEEQTQASENPGPLLAQNTEVKPVCENPADGEAACMAQTLVNKETGKAIHPQLNSAAGYAQTANSPSAILTQPAAPMGTPQYFQQAYDLQALSLTAGTGDTVAIVVAGIGYNPENDLAQWRAGRGLPSCTVASGCLTIVDQNGGTNVPQSLGSTDPSWGFETAIDLDAVSAICPNCNILLVEANSSGTPDLSAAEVTANNLGADQLSNSWSGNDTPYYSSNFVFPGVATVASTGDVGYIDSNYQEYPAAFSGVTAAGGTTLIRSQTPNTARGFTETAWNGSTSSCSNQPQPAWQANANGGCPTRAMADISAAASTSTGLVIQYNGQGWWAGGTSVSAPFIAAYYALVGYGGAGPAWAYDHASFLNDITVGNNDLGYNGACVPSLFYMCHTGPGYDGVTGMGTISGQLVVGAPGVTTSTGCACTGDNGSFVASSTTTSVNLVGGVYPNQLNTRYWWEYGPTTAYEAKTAPTTIGSGSDPVRVANTISGLTSGVQYHYRLVAQNVSGQVSYGETGFTLNTSPDATPPTTTITSHPNALTNSTSAAFTFTSSDSGSTFTCSLDNAAFSSCSSGQSYLSLSDGAHTFHVKATDGGNNTELAPATNSFTIDTTAPATQINSGPNGTVVSSDASFSFSADDANATFECRLDSASWQSCASVKDYTGLNEGLHTFQVRGIDALGNTESGPASRVWTIDEGISPPPPTSTPPPVTPTPPPPATVTPTSGKISMTHGLVKNSRKAAITISCQEGSCNGSVKLKTRAGKLLSSGQAAYDLAAGGETVLSISLSPLAKKLLADPHSQIKAFAVIGGTKFPLTLKAPKARWRSLFNLF